MTWPDSAPAAQDPGADASLSILRSRIDLSALPRLTRDVTEAAIAASADFDFFTDLRCDEDALGEAVAALAAGAPVVADSAMVAAGLTGTPVICKVAEPLTQRLARTASITRAAAAVRLAFGETGTGAVWVCGGGAAGLAEILRRRVEPAFVVGLPAGFAGTAEAKDALRASGIRSVSNVSEKGGPAVAAAVFTALLRSAITVPGSSAGWGPAGPPPGVAEDDSAGW